MHYLHNKLVEMLKDALDSIVTTDFSCGTKHLPFVSTKIENIKELGDWDNRSVNCKTDASQTTRRQFITLPSKDCKNKCSICLCGEGMCLIQRRALYYL